MKKYLNKKNVMAYLYLAAICLIAGLWRGGEMVNAKLALLPVKTMPLAQARAVPTDTKSFYPVWIKRAAALKAEQMAAQQAGDVDGAFNRKDDAKTEVPVPVEPDYAAMTREAIHVDAVADNGAVLNGRFYAIGSALNDFALARPGGGQVVPVLVSVSKDAGVFKVAGASVRITMIRPF